MDPGARPGLENRKRLAGFPRAIPLEAASSLAILMFFLALGKLRPYSARRAWLVRFDACRHV